MGDLRAQVAAVKLGGLRVVELGGKYGLRTLSAAMTGLLDQAERRLRARIAERPDGQGTAVGYLDHDGLGGPPIRVQVTVAVVGDEVAVDFSGTDPQMRGGMNAPRAATMSAVLFAVKAIFDPDGAQNGGCARPIRITLPEGSLVNPRYPAAVSLRHLTAQRITDTLVAAFADLYPETAVAGSFVGFSSMAAEGRHPRTGMPTVIQDDLGGGLGASAGTDGLDAVDTYLGNVGILPAEICETQYPVRILRTELVADSAGRGRWRGGLAIHRAYEFTDTCDLVAYSEQTDPRYAPWGTHGGHAGTPARLVLHRRDGSEERITKTRVTVERGDRLLVWTGGGGGHGDPGERDPKAIERDLREGKMSAAAAAAHHGPGGGSGERDQHERSSHEPDPQPLVGSEPLTEEEEAGTDRRRRAGGRSEADQPGVGDP